MPERAGIPLWVAAVVGVAAIGVVVAAVVLVARPSPGVAVEGAGDLAGIAIASGGVETAAPSPATPLVVEVGGAVARPGVYRLSAGSRVGDAITAAGGFGPRVNVALADRSLNLAAVVKDGDEIHVPVLGEDAGGSANPGTGAGATGSPGGLVDVNRASAEELDTLPGIGPATAAKIIAAREETPFASLDDLVARKVIGAATLAKLRPLATVGR